MHDYDHYSLQDFVADAYFRASVIHPTAETERFWGEWVRQNPHRLVVWQKAYQTVQLLDQSRRQYNAKSLSETQVNSLWTRIEQATSTPVFTDLPQHNSFRRTWMMAASVAAFLIISTGIYFWWNTRTTQTEIYTAYGQIQTVKLPDGSTVILNANSTLRYPTRWSSRADRHIFLIGEAFFQVTHQKNHARFVVHTGELDVEVLGTKFNVNTRRQNTRVTLKEGRVKVNSSKDNRSTFLTKPGEMVEWSAQHRQLAKRVVRVERYAAWPQKRLVFDETPLLEVAQMLEDNFGLTVQIKNPALLTKTLSGEIALDNEQLLLEALHDLYGLDVSRKGQIIILR